MEEKNSGSEKLEKLEKIVTGLIETEPFEREGLKWACRPLAYYCEQIGLSDKTLRLWLKKTPFETRVALTRKWKMVNGVGQLGCGQKVCLIRTGERVMTANDAKNIMAAIWRKRFPEYVEENLIRWENDRRCLLNIAKDLTPQFAVKVFEWTLDNWQTAASAMKLAAEAAPGYKTPFYQFPTIRYVCHFWKACAFAYLSDQQSKGAYNPAKVGKKQANAVAALLCAWDPFQDHPGYIAALEELIALGDGEQLVGKPLVSKHAKLVDNASEAGK
ncbi:MAG: hypothetical protein ACLPSW_19665 [Roseiarcus sp.]